MIKVSSRVRTQNRVPENMIIGDMLFVVLMTAFYHDFYRFFLASYEIPFRAKSPAAFLCSLAFLVYEVLLPGAEFSQNHPLNRICLVICCCLVSHLTEHFVHAKKIPDSKARL